MNKGQYSKEREEYVKEWHRRNWDRVKEIKLTWYYKNRRTQLRKMKEYRNKNKEYFSEYNKQYRIKKLLF